MRRLGVGYRAALRDWLETEPNHVQCLEITAEHFFSDDRAQLTALSKRFPLYVHGLGLSLGTKGPLDEAVVGPFLEVVDAAQPEWISEHVAFTRSGAIDLGHLNPVRCTDESLAILVDHAVELAERARRPLLLENITTHVQVPGTMDEPTFLNTLCEKAKCGLLLDVTNLFVNSRNHSFDPKEWLAKIDPKHVVQYHVVGYSRAGDEWSDSHAERIQGDLLGLIQHALNVAPPRAVILERDRNFPSSDELEKELDILWATMERSGV